MAVAPGLHHALTVGVAATSQQLSVLTHLGHSLPGVTGPQKAASEVVRTLIRLGVAVSVSSVEADQAIVVAARAPLGTHRLLPPSTRLMGIRIPIDRVPWLSRPVRLRRPYVGPVGGIESLHSLAEDHEPADVLPGLAAPIHVVGVPAMVHDQVVAVIHAWSTESLEGLVPTLEAAAAMLAAASEPESRSGARRFAQGTTRRISPLLRAELSALLDDGPIATALQPVVRLLDRSIVGYEALARFSPRAHFSTPDELFAAASALHMEKAVDLACLRAALGEIPSLGPVDLFVNVLIGTLLNERQGLQALEDAVRHAGLDPSSIVLEFSERDPVPNLSRLQRIAAQLRSAGYRIAVDDAGAGHASMQVIAELRPEFMKVDRALIHAIDSHRARRGLVVSLLSFSGHIGARLIAEGVETQRELDTLLSLGVQYGQGWVLGRPVLTQPLEGLTDNTVVDPGWFTRHRVWRLRTPPAPNVAVPDSPGEALDDADAPDLPRALSDAALALQSEHDPMGILGVMAAQMRRVVPVAEMAIYIANYETQRFVPVLATGPDRDAMLAESFSLESGITGWAFARGTPESVPDTWAHPRARQIPGTAVVQESLLLVPLIAGERKLGIINCYRLGVGRFSDSELKASALFAHIAAAAWHNAQLYAELREAAVTDPLTGLYNNRWLRDAGERDLASSARDHTSLALLLIDIDHFKTVNDTCGHAAGDLVLQRLATRLRGSVRAEDAVVRYGGEEFVVLLRRCGTAEAVTIGEALRAAVRQVALPTACPLKQLTASIGVATYPEDGTDLDLLLGAADRAMYAAKHAGRDRVTCAPRPAPPQTIVPLPRRAPAPRAEPAARR
ncbi:MAG: diguanylate cyclase [Candidatus Dormibacteria bacterium]|jgi:diguanylate cyclase (GGDEF)-like protein